MVFLGVLLGVPHLKACTRHWQFAGIDLEAKRYEFDVTGGGTTSCCIPAVYLLELIALKL